MPKSKIILTLGFFTALLPILGFPHSWESFFEVVFGLGIVSLSIMISIDKRLSQKVKAERRQARKRTQLDDEAKVDDALSFGRRVSDVLPDRKRTVRIGRRATDPAVPVVSPSENISSHNIPPTP